ncbi:MAG: zinc ribbon domain-containing protein [Actinomycetota bacterium]|nr:zinc ribbon domain-containing protein [Actinomycetota bacterium]
MPIYEYRCKKCNKKFEKLVRNGDKVACPKCHSKDLTRLFSVFATRSKGEDGEISSIGGSPCSSCSATSCDTCNI